MLLIASKPTLPYPLHCFVLVYVSNCAQHCRCFCAGGPFMTRPLCSRLNIRRRKKRSAINVHPLLHASCMPFRPYLPTLKLLELASLTGRMARTLIQMSKKLNYDQLRRLLTLYMSFYIFSCYVPCSSGVAVVHLFVAEPRGSFCSFENLQTLFVQFTKPQIIIWLQPRIWQIFKNIAQNLFLFMRIIRYKSSTSMIHAQREIKSTRQNKKLR